MRPALRNWLIALGLALLLLLVIPIFWGWRASPDFRGGHMAWPFWMGFGLLFMALFWGLVIAGIVALVRWMSPPGGGYREPPGETPMDILKKRYARGEISKEEFEERRRDLA